MQEPGSSALDHLFSRAENRQLDLVFSVWNVGEFLGVLDHRHRRRDLGGSAFASAVANFADEVSLMIRMGSLQVLPVSESVLVESWNILQKEHIYQADALQIATCKSSNCKLFISADLDLVKAARNQRLEGLDPEKDERKIMAA